MIPLIGRNENFLGESWSIFLANNRNDFPNFYGSLSEVNQNESFPRKYDPAKFGRCNKDRVRTHQSTSETAVRRLGRIIQRIFLPNKEPPFLEPFLEMVW